MMSTGIVTIVPAAISKSYLAVVYAIKPLIPAGIVVTLVSLRRTHAKISSSQAVRKMYIAVATIPGTPKEALPSGKL